MVNVDESNVSVCCCPTMESVANASEPRGKEDQTSYLSVFNFRRYNLVFVLADFKIPRVIRGSRFIWFRLRVIILAGNDYL